MWMTWSDPASDDGRCDVAERDAALAALTGADISDALACSDSLARRLDALMKAIAEGSTDDCDHGRTLRSIVEAACELAVDRKVRQ